jgi:2-aminoadipate transaminase
MIEPETNLAVLSRVGLGIASANLTLRGLTLELPYIPAHPMTQLSGILSMTPTPTLSAAARRTSPPMISSLMQTALANPALISLAAGFVDQESLPAEATAAAVAELLADPVESRRALQYGTTIGDPGLRTQLVRLLERGERAETGSLDHVLPRVVVTQGSQQLLYLVAEALLDPGDIVLVESPTYFVFLGLLETRGARAIGVPVDEGGLRLDALEATLEEIEDRGELDRVKLIYTISEHSNPTGLSLAQDRRGPLVELAERWSKRRRIFILEDAAYRGLVHTDTPEPRSVWGHDRSGETVILARTFSKTFSPGMKTGFGVLPEKLLKPVLGLKGNHDFGSSNFQQQVFARLLANGSYDRQVARLRALYRRKRDVILEALADQFAGLDGAVSWTKPAGGLFIWFSAPEEVDLGPLGPVWPRCQEEGVLYVPGQYAFAHEPTPPATNHARLCFGVPDEDELIEGVRRLATALEGCMDPVA